MRGDGRGFAVGRVGSRDFLNGPVDGIAELSHRVGDHTTEIIVGVGVDRAVLVTLRGALPEPVVGKNAHFKQI